MEFCKWRDRAASVYTRLVGATIPYMTTITFSKERTSILYDDDEFAIESVDVVPILYRPEVNISFYGLEKLHPFDACKYQHIAERLVQSGVMKDRVFIGAAFVSDSRLLTIHTKEYLDSLNYSSNVATVLELPALAWVPNFLLQSALIMPMRYQAGATIKAGRAAIFYGWAICLSGGMHHASSSSGGGWCVFSDIPLSIKKLRDAKMVKKVMIIDLDVHQGNGHERDKLDGKMGDPDDIYIVDAYNCWVYPKDQEAKKAINVKIEYRTGCDGEKFLSLLWDGLRKAFDEFKPDIIYYNAGTDLLAGDPLGQCDIPEQDVITRDEWVFQEAMERKIPIVMVLSGGYQESNARVIATSIINLENRFKLFAMAEERWKKAQIK
jgi:histone deacetylase 11